MKPIIAPPGRCARLVPQEVKDNSKKMAAYWKTLCEKYPMVKEAARKSA